MIPLLTRDEARAVDAGAVEDGVPSLVLMENAGLGATREILAHFSAATLLGPILCVGGPGQNGGDAWVVARQLHARGVLVETVLVGGREQVRGDAAINLQALSPLGLTPVEILAEGDLGEFEERIGRATLVVDGIFGTGLTRDVGGLFSEVITAINAGQVPVVALDLPSGVDGDTGAVMGVATRAELTLTFAGSKRGLHQHPAARLAGRLVTVPIGVRASRYVLPDVAEIERDDLRHALPMRLPDVHKGSAGHVLVFGGEKTGAALLAARAAFRGGAGLVTLAGAPTLGAIAASRMDELMFTPVLDREAARRALAGKGAAVLGPGLGLGEEQEALALGVLREHPGALVVDADALTLLAQSEGGIDQLRDSPGARVLTPHPGEAARLLGTSSADVQRDRFAAAHALARRARQVVVLKGARTLVATPREESEDILVRVVPFGTPALAVAGSGDVLAGILAALLANVAATPEPTPLLELVAAGCGLHALAGEAASSVRGGTDRGVLASELADAVPRALAELLA